MLHYDCRVGCPDMHHATRVCVEAMRLDALMKVQEIVMWTMSKIAVVDGETETTADTAVDEGFADILNFARNHHGLPLALVDPSDWVLQVSDHRLKNRSRSKIAAVFQCVGYIV